MNIACHSGGSYCNGCVSGWIPSRPFMVSAIPQEIYMEICISSADGITITSCMRLYSGLSQVGLDQVAEGYSSDTCG
jgi:hypothetical protein